MSIEKYFLFFVCEMSIGFNRSERFWKGFMHVLYKHLRESGPQLGLTTPPPAPHPGSRNRRAMGEACHCSASSPFPPALSQHWPAALSLISKSTSSSSSPLLIIIAASLHSPSLLIATTLSTSAPAARTSSLPVPAFAR